MTSRTPLIAGNWKLHTMNDKQQLFNLGGALAGAA